MKIVEFLTELRKSEIQISLADDKLKIKAPSGALTNEIKKQLKERKEDIIEFLQQSRSGTESGIPKVERNGPMPLSFTQQGLWFIDQMSPGSAAYNMPFAFKLFGDLDEACLRKTLSLIWSRHESLRARFVADDDGNPFQEFRGEDELDYEFETESAPDQQAAGLLVKEKLKALSLQPFDLETDPLFRVRVYRFQIPGQSEPMHALVGCMHHIISDGWSLNVLMRELAVIYASTVQQATPMLPDLPIQYADFAHWQRNWLQGDTLQKQLGYWKQQLEDLPGLLALPTDRPRPTTQTNNGARYEFHYPPDFLTRIESFSKAHEVTPFMTLMAAWQLVLAKWANQDKFCVGIPMLGRTRKETESLIGFFVNALMIRGDVSGNPTGKNLLDRIKETVLGAFNAQDIPLQLILDEMDIQRSMAYQPLAQVGFQLQNFSGGAQISDAETSLLEQFAQATRLRMERVGLADASSKYDIILSMGQHPSHIEGYVEYNTDLFDETTMATLVDHLHKATEWLMANLELPIACCELVDENQLREALAIAPEETVCRATETQTLLFIDSILHPESLQNATGYLIPFQGRFDKATLIKSLQHIAESFAILRTRFVGCDIPYADTVYQVISPKGKVVISEEDITTKELSITEAIAYAEAWIYRPYDVLVDPLWSFRLFRLDDNHILFACRGHHLAIDGATYGIHADMLAQTYGAIASGEPLPEYEDNFADYVQWSHQHMDAPEVLDYWREQLKTVSPLDFSKPPEFADRDCYTIKSHAFNDQLSEKIVAWCKDQKVHPADFFRLLMAFMLKQYCRAENDFVIYDIQGGRIPGHFQTLGVYYQQVPIKFALDSLTAEQAFIDTLTCQTEQKKSLKAYRRLNLQTQKDLVGTGRINFQFNYYNFIKQIKLGDAEGLMRIQSPRVENTTQLIVKEAHGKFTPDLWMDERTFADLDFLPRMERLAQQIIDGSAADFGQLQLVSDSERQQFNAWNQRSAQPADYTTIVEWFESQVTQSPDSVAVQFGEQSLTYQALNERANQLAHWLIEQGVQTNQKVAVCLGRCLNMPVAVWGVLKSGAAYVPVDANYPKERLAFILEDAGASVLLSESCLKQRLPDSTSSYSANTLLLMDEQAEQLDAYTGENPSLQRDGSDLIYVIYTSGSTGKPKGAAVQHQGEVNLLHWYTHEMGMNAQDKLLLISAFGFDLTQKNLFAPFLVGATLVIPPMDQYDDQIVLNEIETHGISWINCAPSAFYPVVAGMNDQRAQALKTLRYLVLGGEPIRLDQLQTWLEHPLSQCQLVNSYGPTECTDVVSYHCLENIKAGQDLIPIGRPIGNMQLHILDDALHPLPVGVVGELCITGTGVGAGYLNRNDLTEDVFVPNPFGDGRLYKTGDLARYLADGEIEYIGRKDFQVKLRGLRIELGEIEFALRQLQPVRDGLVLVKNDQLVAYVVTGGAELGEWRQPLAEYLPDYMIPSHVMCLDRWPLTPNGKVDRKALPNPDHSQRSVPFVAPRNEVESTLVAIWQDILKVDHVGVKDNFFDLGGHSLLATQVASRARKAFNIQIQLRDLLGEPTIESIAAQVEKLVLGAVSEPTIPQADRSQPIPLSFAQQRLWLLDKIEPGSVAYNVPFVIRIKGKLDVEKLAGAYQQVISRHEALRTVFVATESGACQQFLALKHFNLAQQVLDSETVDESYLRRLVSIEVMTPFQLETGPLVRAKLLQLNQDEHVLVMVAHHIVTDGWSMTLVAKDLVNAYLGTSLQPLQIQYADFAAWQRASLSDSVLADHMAFWQTQLAEVEPLSFPVDRVRPTVQSYNGRSIAFKLAPQTKTHFEQLARQNGTTLFNVLLAAYSTILHRYTGQQNFAIGTPVAGRDQEELENLVGFFVNTLAIPVSLDHVHSFTQLINQMKETMLSAQAHQQVPFEQIVEAVNPVRDMSRSPIFQTMLVYQNIPLDQEGNAQVAAQLGDLSFEPVGLDVETAKFELTLTLAESAAQDGGLEGVLQYNTDLFLQSTAQQLIDHFTRLCDQLADAPEKPLHAHNFLMQAEIDQQVIQWNQTQHHYDQQQTVHQWISEQAAKTPDAIAVTCGKQRLTYTQLERAANQIALSLIEDGVQPDQCVGLCFDRHLYLLPAILGILKAGAVYVPLDANYPEDRIAYILQDAGIKVILTRGEIAEKLPARNSTVIAVDQLLQEDESVQEDKSVKAQSAIDQSINREPDADRRLYVIYTSGSTGKPKGTSVYHRAEVNLLTWYTQQFAMNATDRVLLVSAIGFDLTQKNLFAPLVCGATLVIPDFQEFDSNALVELIHRDHITWLNCAPSAFYPLQDHSDDWIKLRSLQHVFLGGEPINLQRLQHWANQSNCKLINSYGPTECTDIAAWYEIDIERDIAAPVLPIGRPNHNVNLFVLGQHNELLPVGAVGELHIGGDSVGAGYLNNQALTDAVFISNPFPVGGDKIYKTGDRVRYRADGNVEYLGRRDHQIKLRGFRIETGEIQAIINENSRVTDSLVAVHKTASGEHLVAWVVINTGEYGSDQTSLMSELEEACRKALPAHMVPTAWVLLDTFPLTPNGKVDRKALPAPTLEDDKPFEAPNSATESSFAQLWQTILGIPQVGRRDNFFQLGGHSLLATQVIARLVKQLDVDVSVRTLFEHPVLADFAEQVDITLSKGGAKRPPLKRLALTEAIPLSYGQQRIWFFEKMYPDSTANNMPGAVRIKGAFDIEALSQAVNEVVRRHESLRTVVYENDEGQPLQRVLPHVAITVARLATVADDLAAITHIAEQDRSFKFDLTQGPLLRVRIAPVAAGSPTGAEQHILYFCMHHMVSDGISVSNLFREFALLYHAFSQRQPSPLPELLIHYPDYAVWQRDFMAGELLQQQLQYWQQHLNGAPPLITMPTDFPRPSVQTTNGTSLPIQFSTDFARKLHEFTQTHNVTAFMVMLLAWKLLLAKYANQKDILVGVPTAGRSQSELEALIGFFINSVVLRTDLANNPTVLAALQRVKQTVLGGFANGDVPVDLVLERLAVERNPAYSPLAQVAFQLMTEDSFAVDGNNFASQLGDLEFEPIVTESSTAKFDMTMTLNLGSDYLSGSLEFNTDLYKAGTIEQLIRHFIHTAEALLSQPELPIDRLQFCHQDELYQHLGLDPAEYEAIWPLASMQYDMFMDNLVNPSTLQSSHGWKIPIHRELDLAVWQQVVQAFVDHQPAVRARFVASRQPYLDMGYLAIRRHYQVPFALHDVSDQNLSEAEALDFIDEKIYQPYDIINDDLVSHGVVKLADDHYIVYTAVHHAIQDGASLSSEWAQLTKAYVDYLAEQPLQFVPDSFPEFIAQDRATVDAESVVEFWREKLRCVEPLDYTVPAPVPEPGKAITKELILPDGLGNAVKAFSRKKRITPALFFKTLFGLMIKTYCRPDADFQIQETMGGRSKGHFESQGCYIQEIPFVFTQASIQQQQSIDDLLAYARSFQKEIKNYRLISIGKQIEICPRGRIGFMYNYYHFLEGVEFLGETIFGEGTPSDPANNVQFVVTEVAEGIKLNLFYHPHLFADFDMLRRIESLCEQVVVQGVEQLNQLQFVTDSVERKRLLLDWNHTTEPFDLSKTVHQVFEQQVEQSPQETAIRDDNVSYSYLDLNQRANQLARYLVACGVARNDLVGLCADRSADFLVGILGIMKAGGAYVPMDPKYPQDRITYMRDNSQVSVLLSQSHLKDKVLGSDKVKIICLDTDWLQIAEQETANLNLPCSPQDRAYMIYTSGSTGLPKGAIVRHDGAFNHIEAERLVLEFDGAFSFLQTAPCSSDISVWQFLGPITCGGQVVVLDDVTHAKKLFELVKAHAIDVVELVPVALQLLMEYVRSLPQEDRSLPALRWMMATGEAVSVDLVNKWLQLYPEIPVVNAYGPTEAADDVIQCAISEPLAIDRRSVPIGKPLANLDVFIVDEQMRLVPGGVAGEICIGGVGVGEGYWQNPEKTNAAFVPNPFPESKGGMIYKTGDLGRWLADGTVEYLDRVDNQVKVRGFRIELGEVEAAVTAIDAVREGVVIVRDDLPGGKALAAYVVAREPGSPLDMTALRTELRQRLPDFMIPAAIMQMEKLPLTPAGKVDRKALPKPEAMVVGDAEYIAPRSELEKELVDMWETLLPVERVSIKDSFFDLGGHSLLGVRLISQINQSLGISIQVNQLLAAPTIEQLAQLLESIDEGVTQYQPLIELRKGEGEPLVFIHPVGGDVLCYQDLVRALADYPGPVYGLRARGFGEERPFTNMAEMLDVYLHALRALSNESPLHLAAQSLGGVIAMALANELIEEQRAIGNIWLFDTFTPQEMALQTSSEIEVIEAALGITLPKDVKKLAEQGDDQWLDSLYQQARDMGVIPQDIDLQSVKAIRNVAVTNHKLVANFELSQRLPENVYHFAAQQRCSGEKSNVDWQRIGAQFEFLEAAGDHESMIRGDHALQLVKAMMAILKRN